MGSPLMTLGFGELAGPRPMPSLWQSESRSGRVPATPSRELMTFLVFVGQIEVELIVTCLHLPNQSRERVELGRNVTFTFHLAHGVVEALVAHAKYFDFLLSGLDACFVFAIDD